MTINKKDFLIHFIGIGGVSMSGLAEYCCSHGFAVSGSDRAYSLKLEKLNDLGVKIFIGHDKTNVQGAQVVVYNDAINADNEEIIQAKEQGSYVLGRAELLNMISENFSTVVGVAGCHGKTTVTCMLAHIFTEANIPFTAHIGGDDLAYGNFINRGNQVFLSEVCEFKKNITKFNAHYAVCLNTGKDHMDCYSDEKELENAYISYVKRAYKSIIGVNDDVLNFYNGDNAVGFSIYNDSDFSAKNLKNNNGFFIFDLYIRGEKRAKIKMPIVGEYNVKNALAAIACSYEMGISLAKIKKGIKSFKGVKRRHEFLGFLNGGRVIADYAHHPTEIKSSISATKENCKGKVFVCFQPHTYSRTLFLKEEFVEALSSEENLVIFKTYSAREEYILGGGAEDLCTLLPNSVYVEDIEKVIEFFKTKMTKKDCLLILGAGDLYDIIKYKIVK